MDQVPTSRDRTRTSPACEAQEGAGDVSPIYEAALAELLEAALDLFRGCQPAWRVVAVVVRVLHAAALRGCCVHVRLGDDRDRISNRGSGQHVHLVTGYAVAADATGRAGGDDFTAGIGAEILLQAVHSSERWITAVSSHPLQKRVVSAEYHARTITGTNVVVHPSERKVLHWAVEYQALTNLLWLVPLYVVTSIGVAVVVLWVHIHSNYGHVNSLWTALFLSVSAFTNCGFSLNR